MCIGEKIKEYIAEKNITQTQLSVETKIPLPKLNLALSGKRRMTFDEYEVICGVLNLGVDKFLTPKLPSKSKRIEGSKNENIS
jgi:transcriptional regulator with XRE-family HTH domain